MRPSIWIKDPWEERILEIDTTDGLATGDSLKSITSVDMLLGNTSLTSTMVGSSSVNGNKVLVLIKGGTDGTDYTLRVRIETTNGEKLEDDITIQVRD